MNRNTVIGLALVLVAGALTYVFAFSGALSGLFGKAVWYLPYVALVGGIRQLVRARG